MTKGQVDRPLRDEKLAHMAHRALDLNRQAEAAVIASRRMALKLVSELRRAGLSWSQIGDQFGCSGAYIAGQYEHDYDDPFMTPPHIQESLWPPKMEPRKYATPRGPAKGTGGCPPKLTREQVAEIRRLHLDGDLTLQAIGDRYDVDASTVWRIVHEVNWANV